MISLGRTKHRAISAAEFGGKRGEKLENDALRDCRSSARRRLVLVPPGRRDRCDAPDGVLRRDASRSAGDLGSANLTPFRQLAHVRACHPEARYAEIVEFAANLPISRTETLQSAGSKPSCLVCVSVELEACRAWQVVAHAPSSRNQRNRAGCESFLPRVCRCGGKCG